MNSGRGYRLSCCLVLSVMAVIATFSLPLRAAQTGDKIYYLFTGNMVMTTPCTVNDDQPVSVTFGNVSISKIDSGQYLQNLKYHINCGGATSASKVRLTIKATPEVWNEKAMVTSVSGLGAEILHDSSPVTLNKAMEVPDPANPPSLQVLLVKDPAATLTDQAFTAAGTLVATYE